MYIGLFIHVDDHKVNFSNLLSENSSRIIICCIHSHKTYLQMLWKLHKWLKQYLYCTCIFFNTSFSRWYHYLRCSVAFWRGLCSRGVHNLHCPDSDRTADGCLDDKNLALGHGCSWSVQFGNLYRFSHRFAELLW